MFRLIIGGSGVLGVFSPASETSETSASPKYSLASPKYSLVIEPVLSVFGNLEAKVEVGRFLGVVEPRLEGLCARLVIRLVGLNMKRLSTSQSPTVPTPDE